MKRSPLKRHKRVASQNTLKRSPMQRKSKGKAAKAKEFPQDIRNTVKERSHGRCEYCGKYPITEIHHAGTFRSHLGREQGSGGLGNAIGLCVFCNNLVHGGKKGQKYRLIFAERAKQLAEGHSIEA